MINYIAADSSVEKSITVTNDDTVKTKLTCSRKAGDAEVAYFDWTYDFSGVSRHDLMRVAVTALNIKLQGKFRKMDAKDAEEYFAQSEWSVAELIAERKRGKSKVEKGVDHYDTLSAEDQALMLEQLLARQKKSA